MSRRCLYCGDINCRREHVTPIPPTAPDPVGEARCGCGEPIPVCGFCGNAYAAQLAALRAENERLKAMVHEALCSEQDATHDYYRYRRALEQARDGLAANNSRERLSAADVLAIIDAALGDKP